MIGSLARPARVDFRALGTGAVVMVADADRLQPALAAAKTEIAAIDAACSRFRPDSDLARVNVAGGRAVAADHVLIEALDVALGAAETTGGAVDPTIGRALRLMGYDRDFASLRSGPPVARVAEVPGWRSVVVDRHRGTVRVPAGVELDLGATAKAFAADRAAAAALEVAGCAVLVSLGGDIACAGVAPDDGWSVFVTDWHGADDDAPGQEIAIHDGGLATSSTTVRRWRRGTVELHHLVDPATGCPAAEVWRTVSVAAASCVQANIASTAAIVMGERGLDWLRSLAVPARLVRADGEVIRIGGWPEDGDDVDDAPDDGEGV